MRRATHVVTLLFILLLVWLLRHLQLRELLGIVASARLSWFLLAVLLQMVVVADWALLLSRFSPKQLPFPRIFQATALTSLSFMVAPSIAAHASGVGFLMQRCRVSLRDAAAMIAGEQVAETVAKVVLLIVALYFAPFSAETRHVARVVAAVFAVTVVLVVFVGRHWKRAPEFFREPRTIGSGVMVALSIKVLEALALVCAQRSIGAVFGVDAVIFILALISLGIAAASVLPVPGPVGVGEAMVAGAYTQLGVSLETGVALVAIQTAALLAARLVLGGGVMFLRNKDVTSITPA